MATVLDVIDAFDKQEFTRVQQFIKEIKEARDLNVPYTPVDKPTKQAEFDSAFPYLQDITNGPLSDGINTLHGTSDVIRGVPLQSIQIFGYYTFIYSPFKFKDSDVETGILMTIDTLGMTSYFNQLKSINQVEYTNFKQFIEKIYKIVKSGGFKKEQWANTIKINCKKIIRICLNYRQKV